MAKPLIFDGHNDVLLHLLRSGRSSAADAFIEGRQGALDFPKAQIGGFCGGFFAVYVPSPTNKKLQIKEMTKPSYGLSLPNTIQTQEALPVALAAAAILFDLEKTGFLRVCRSVSDIRAAIDLGYIAAVFHIEGAEAIDTDLNTLEVLYQAGLRSIGPVWSRPNAFGNGVPFRYPSHPDIGAGLTAHGFKLVKRCDELGIMIDVSHLNAAGFWDVACTSKKPLVASHSNAYGICPHSRNLTDEQLAAIKASDGMVGLNFAVAFLREDGQMLSDVPIEQMLRHLDYLMKHLGEDRVGLGSDYDGAIVPEEIKTVASLPILRSAMLTHGYDDSLMTKLCHENWFRVLEKSWDKSTGTVDHN